MESLKRAYFSSALRGCDSIWTEHPHCSNAILASVVSTPSPSIIRMLMLSVSSVSFPCSSRGIGQPFSRTGISQLSTSCATHDLLVQRLCSDGFGGRKYVHNSRCQLYCAQMRCYFVSGAILGNPLMSTFVSFIM